MTSHDISKYRTLEADEYARFLHYVNDSYHSKFKGKKYGYIFIDDIYYRFRIVEYNEYEIVYRKELT